MPEYRYNEVHFKMVVNETNLRYDVKGGSMSVATAASLFEDIRYEPVECFAVLYLNVRNRVLSRYTLSRGGQSETMVDPRELFRAALLCGASSVICAHNHPSGDLTPSNADINLTKQLMQAGDLLGVRLQDHIIVGPRIPQEYDMHGVAPEYYSIHEHAWKYDLKFKG